MNISIRHNPKLLHVRVIDALVVVLVTFMVVACGGGETAQSQPAPSATSETINGVTVPPEPPAALNSETIVGVDSNSNGIRDDVERLLAQKFGTSQKYADAKKFAQLEQSLLTNPIPASAQAYGDYVDCMTLAASDTDELTHKLINTNARSLLYSSLMAGQLISGCKK